MMAAVACVRRATARRRLKGKAHLLDLFSLLREPLLLRKEVFEQRIMLKLAERRITNGAPRNPLVQRHLRHCLTLAP